MSVIIGTVRNFESKPSQYGDGNFERIQIETDNGYKSWYTSYANRHVDVGEEITAELRTSKKSNKEYIASFELRGAEQAQRDRGYESQPKAQTPATGAHSGSQEERQLSIVSQAIFKTTYNPEKGIQEQIDTSIKAALYLEKRVRAAVAAKHVNAAKELLEAQENEDLSQSQSTDSGAEPDFDDTIPF